MADDNTDDVDSAESLQDFSPREFLRQRKPRAFSDSETVEKPAISREFLEYYFHTLTNRSQEIAFENFARKLAQREICPNLEPHTGPTGGGDSKVDTESYAVAEELALTWYYGYGAHNERWAFAFSAKEKWREKVQSDIKKIAETNRGYTKAIFISSRFIRDRERSEVEDALTKKHKLQVQIHDRNWVLDRIFEGSRHFDLLVSEFGLREALTPAERKGPLDRDREEEFAEIEVRITSAGAQNTFGPPVVDDCLEAVRVARALERPRRDIDGMLMRAARVAEKAGTAHQRMMVAYETAWTAFWFYDDSSPLATVYGVVETHALETRNISDLELVANLWLLLRTSVARGWLDAELLEFTRRSETLRTALQEAAADDTRPSGALYAQTMLLELDLIGSEEDDAGPLLIALRDILLNSEGHLGYPLMRVIDRMLQLSEHFEAVEEYDELYATMATLRGRREGNTAEALMYLERGQRHVQQKRPFAAIRVFGRVLSRLYTDESRDQVSVALFLCGFAFEEIGLLWAARAATLHAANIASADFYTKHELNWLQSAGYNRLKWFELKLGRVPSIMAWHELDIMVRAALTQQNRTLPAVHSDHLFDLLIGVLLLKVSDEQLPRLTGLPDAFDRIHLYLAAGTARYLLGHEPDLPEDLLGKDPDQFFQKLALQPAARQLPPSVALDVYGGVEGRVLGCRVQATTDGQRSSVFLAESIVAMVESFLATADHHDVIAGGPRITIDVRHHADLSTLLEYTIHEDYGVPHVDVATNIPTRGIPASAQLELKKTLSHLLGEFVARAFHFRDVEATFAKLHDEEALSRAVDFGLTLIVQTNIEGDAPKDAVEDWKEADDQAYAVKRASVPRPPSGSSPLPLPRRDVGDEDAEVEPTHDELENVSLIRNSLWQRAGWYGTAFFMSPDLSKPPTLALLFRDPVAAEEIFKGWERELGATDPHDRLRISIVRGVTREYPLAYTVLIGTNFSSVDDELNKRVMTFTRGCRMDAQSDTHLLNFLMRYERLKEYTLEPAILDGDAASAVGSVTLRKKSLYIRNAWEIGLNDPDAAAIAPAEQVIIPDDVTSPPVVELQAWLRAVTDRTTQ